jgi:hypothetical protein
MLYELHNVTKEFLHFKNGNFNILIIKEDTVLVKSSNSKILLLLDYDSELFNEIKSKIEIKTLFTHNGGKFIIWM